MEDYKAFIKEVTSLHIKVVRLLKGPTEIYSLNCFTVERHPVDELTEILMDNNWSIKKYWDLSHYSTLGEKYFGDNYQHKLSEMAKLALIDILSLNTGKEMLRTIDQFLVPFKRFHTNYYNEDMNQYIYAIPPDFGMNITYNQFDLRQNFINCFDVTGIADDNDGYSPDFIQQLYDIFVKKRGVLELLKTNLSGGSDVPINRKNPFSNELTQFSFDSVSGEWITSKGITGAGGNKKGSIVPLGILSIKNNFDNIEITNIYNHFKARLVDKEYLSDNDLVIYLNAAFNNREIPKTLFCLKDVQSKQKIIRVFKDYYYTIANQPHGRQKEYAGLLGDYFLGYKTKNVSSNFTK